MTKEFGELLSRYRGQRGLTQVELANLAGDIASNWISRAEGGKHNIGRRTAQKIAEALDLPDEQRAEFYLLSQGHPQEEVERILKAASATELTSTELKIGDVLVLINSGRKVAIVKTNIENI